MFFIPVNTFMYNVFMSKDLKIKSRQILIDNNIPVTKPRLLLIEILLKNRGPIKIEEIIKLKLQPREKRKKKKPNPAQRFL